MNLERIDYSSIEDFEIRLKPFNATYWNKILRFLNSIDDVTSFSCDSEDNVFVELDSSLLFYNCENSNKYKFNFDNVFICQFKSIASDGYNIRLYSNGVNFLSI
ncbi:hypothetical protein AL538_19145 [Vibrio harveyi]|uniref:Uncharacterized protein n=1 Tax=Vibrio harveyi TaxID=669 RepID=A0ABN4L542_VIBHA|nr:hypothetical protein AL538_19145 [Vibrio harveyi]